MREVLVAVFETVAKAEQAVRALENAHIAKSAIRRYHRDDPAIPHARYHQAQETTTSDHQESRGFWGWLLGEENTTSDWRDPNYGDSDRLYGRSIERGDTVVAVYTDPVDSERVMRLLADQLPIDVRDLGAESGVTGTATTDTGVTGTAREVVRGGAEERIALAREEVEIGKRRVDEPVQVHRYTVERPVEKDVQLRDERVTIERRPATGAADPSAFQERTVEVRESHEVPVVERRAKADEEVVVHRETGQRTERVRETAREEEVRVDRPGHPQPQQPQRR